MRKYLTILCLSCFLCILLSSSGCFFIRGTERYTVFSDPDRNVSLVGGTESVSLGIVIDDKEFLVFDKGGNERFRKIFQKRIIQLDMLYYLSLLVFEDGSIEIYSCDDKQNELISEYSFETGIVKAELMRKSSAIVLLDNGELWKSAGDDYSEFNLIESGVVDCSYSISSGTILCINEGGDLKCSSNRYKLSPELQSLSGVKEIKDAYYYSDPDKKIRYMAICESESYFISVDSDADKVYLSDVTPVLDPETLDVSKTISEGVSYRENGKYYYEGPSKNERDYYGGRYKNRFQLSVPEGYSIHTILGGVIFYNDHEVKVLLIN